MQEKVHVNVWLGSYGQQTWHGINRTQYKTTARPKKKALTTLTKILVFVKAL